MPLVDTLVETYNKKIKKYKQTIQAQAQIADKDRGADKPGTDVKGRLLVPNLVTCYSRNAQRDWIECLRLRSREQKCKFLKDVHTTFLKE